MVHEPRSQGYDRMLQGSWMDLYTNIALHLLAYHNGWRGSLAFYLHETMKNSKKKAIKYSKKFIPNCQHKKILVLHHFGKKREITKEQMVEEIHQHVVCNSEGGWESYRKKIRFICLKAIGKGDL